MKRLIVLLLLIAWSVLFKVYLSDYILRFPEAAGTIAFGIILLGGYLLSDLFVPLKLPRITAYLAAGLLMGPFAFGIISRESLENLRFIDDLALNFIGLAAGAELHLPELKRRMKPILFLIAAGGFIVFGGMVIGLRAMALPVFIQDSGAATWTAIILVSVIALARSPSSTIAVISETRSRGPFTETIMGVTVSFDVAIILLFAMALSAAASVLSADHSFNLMLLANILVSLLLSFAIGILLGTAISLYFGKIASETIFFVLALVFSVSKLSEFATLAVHNIAGVTLHLEPMIMCMTAGFVARNFCRTSGKFIEAIEKGSLPVYVLFFVLTGAHLHASVLVSYWHVALILFTMRLVFMISGGYFSARLAGEPPYLCRLYGMAFITQAGVSFGLVRMMKTTFPEWAPVLGTVLTATIIINELIGPILIKIALDRSGEAGRRE
ncbi:MAG TPA: cation:proton antiporter [bacterium]|nr:cation:proton antiporter [bacterium]